MRITDKEAKRELKLVNSCDLNESVENYPEHERAGRTDLQFIADEISYIISLYLEDDTAHYDDLNWAKEVLRATKNGKVFPVWKSTLRPVYNNNDVYIAKNIINEYRRLNSSMKRLNKKGYIGRWL